MKTPLADILIGTLLIAALIGTIVLLFSLFAVLGG